MKYSDALYLYGVLMALLVLGFMTFLAVKTGEIRPCESDCVRIGVASYYKFPVILDGKECVALSKYSDGSGMVGINCD